jgi:hypothetical protein
MSDSTSRPALSSETPPVPPSGPTGGGYPSQPSGAGSPPPGAPRHRGGGLPVPLVFVGGLVVVAGVTGLVLAARPKASPYTTFDPSSPYELPRVRGVERRKPRPGSPPPPGPRLRGPRLRGVPAVHTGEGVYHPRRSRTVRGPDSRLAASAVPRAPPPCPPRLSPPVEVASAPAPPDIPSPAGTPTALALPTCRPPARPVPLRSLPGPSPRPERRAAPAPASIRAAGPPHGAWARTVPRCLRERAVAASTPEASPTPIRKAGGPCGLEAAHHGGRSPGHRLLRIAPGRSATARHAQGARRPLLPDGGDEAEARSGVRFVVERRASSLTLTEVRAFRACRRSDRGARAPAGLVPTCLWALAEACRVPRRGARRASRCCCRGRRAAAAPPRPEADRAGLRVLLAYARCSRASCRRSMTSSSGSGRPRARTVARS